MKSYKTARIESRGLEDPEYLEDLADTGWIGDDTCDDFVKVDVGIYIPREGTVQAIFELLGCIRVSWEFQGRHGKEHLIVTRFDLAQPPSEGYSQGLMERMAAEYDAIVRYCVFLGWMQFSPLPIGVTMQERDEQSRRIWVALVKRQLPASKKGEGRSDYIARIWATYKKAGRTQAQLASDLGISHDNVRSHVAIAKRKAQQS